MRPATALTPDGPQNVLDAITGGAGCTCARVVAVCAGTIHAARYVQKSHPYRLDAFDSAMAVLGYVEEGRVRWVHECPVEGCDAPLPGLDQPSGWPRVEVVFSHAGANGATVRAMCASATLGRLLCAASWLPEPATALCTAIWRPPWFRPSSKGVHVVRTTRCAYGAVVPGAVSPLAVGQGLVQGALP